MVSSLFGLAAGFERPNTVISPM